MDPRKRGVGKSGSPSATGRQSHRDTLPAMRSHLDSIRQEVVPTFLKWTLLSLVRQNAAPTFHEVHWIPYLPFPHVTPRYVA